MIPGLTSIFPIARKIAVTGIAGGGKTVFMTSMLSHLIEHDPYHFRFGSDARILNFRERKPAIRYGEHFRLDAFRDALSREQRWPSKTRDCAHYACEFRRSDWALRNCRLHFFDLPGERIADAAIAAHSSFAEWSDHLIKHLEAKSDYRAQAQEFLKLQKQENLAEETILTAYKTTLARLILSYKPLISPSTFLLDANAEPAREKEVDALATARASGLDGQEFAPLNTRARKHNPALAKAFAIRYRAYRREIVLPVFEELKDADRLVVLVDIPSLLAGGDGRYNDNRQILNDLFDTLRPGSLLGARLLSLFGVNLWPLKRVAFVAAKADTVHPEDVENGRLHGLLRSMTDRARQMLPGVQCQWFVSSACLSTRPGNGTRSLIGRPANGNPEGAEMEFEVSEVPTKWPSAWEPGDFQFYRVLPQVPRNLQIPPAHIGLDRIFDFISEGNP